MRALPLGWVFTMKLFVRACFLFLIGASAASAQVISNLGGSITASPEMNVVLISTPNCAGASGSLVNYSAQPFTVSASGSYQLTGSAGAPLTASDLAYYVYQSAFDPANNTVNCIGAANNSPPVIPALALTAGTQYFLVAIDDTFAPPTNTTPATYNVVFSGPGAVIGAVASVAQVPTLSQLSLVLLALLLALTRPWRRFARG